MIIHTHTHIHTQTHTQTNFFSLECAIKNYFAGMRGNQGSRICLISSGHARPGTVSPARKLATAQTISMDTSARRGTTGRNGEGRRGNKHQDPWKIHFNSPSYYIFNVSAIIRLVNTPSTATQTFRAYIPTLIYHSNGSREYRVCLLASAHCLQKQQDSGDRLRTGHTYY